MNLKPLGNNVAQLNLGRFEILLSYGTPVAAFIPGKGYVRSERKFSKTSSRHVNDWMGKGGAEVPHDAIVALMTPGRSTSTLTPPPSTPTAKRKVKLV